MTLSIGLLSHNGYVGKPIFKYLLPAAQEGKIHLVVLHRPSSDISSVPAGEHVETREVDLETGDLAKNTAAVKGLNIVISAVASAGVGAQTQLIPALKDSKDLITFIPSVFGAAWTEDEIVVPELGFLTLKDRVHDAFRAAGIPLTILLNGALLEWAFNSPPFTFGPDAKGNALSLFAEAQEKELPISSVDYIGAGVAQLVLTRPNELANKTFYLLEVTPTGNEIAQAFEKIHGAPPKIEIYTQESFAADTKAMPLALSAVFKLKWARGNFGFEGERVQVDGWEGKGLEGLIRSVLA